MEGAALWRLVGSAVGLTRYSLLGGPIGFDWPAILALAPGAGLEPAAVLALLPSLEAGMLAAVAERAEDDAPEDDAALDRACGVRREG